MKEYGRWPGYHERPLTDPQTDTRRKLVVEDQGTRVYGVQNISISDAVNESEGVLVLTYRIRVDSEGLFELAWEDMQPSDWENLNLAVPSPTPEMVWATMSPPRTEEEALQSPITQNHMTLTNVKVTFTGLATYMDIQSEFPMGLGTRPEDQIELGPGLAFEWFDESGKAIPCLGSTISGTYESGSMGNDNYERNRHAAFWPAVKAIPDTITLRAFSEYTGEYLATFTIPLVPAQDGSPETAP